MRAARILVDGQSDLVLDYGIPPEAGDVKPGCRVQVPLRNRTATGTVLTLSEPAPAWKRQAQAHSETDRSGAPDFPGDDESGLMGGGLLLRGSGSDDPVSAPGNRSSGKYGGKNAQNGVSGKTPAREELDALYRKAPRHTQMLDYFSSAKQQSAPWRHSAPEP